MFARDLPDLDLEISSLHEPAVSAFPARYGAERLSPTSPSPTGLPALGTLRLGIHVSLGARQAVRTVGAALGLDPIALNSLARQVPLLSSPGAIEQVLTRAPELGGGLAATFEPGQTILRIAAQLEGLPQRSGAHPSAYAVSFLGPGALSWLPALWVSADRPGTSRFGGPRHLAVAGLEADDAGTLAHPSSPAPNLVGAGDTSEDDETANYDDVLRTAAGIPGGPVLVAAFDKADFEALGVPRLDISTSAAMATAAAAHPSVEGFSEELKQGAWKLLAAGDTRCISQVETPGMQALLRRLRDAAESSPRPALTSLEDLAQLLALWRPGAYGKDREQAYLTALFGSQRPALIHPSLAPIFLPTHNELLYADQVVQILRLFGFSHAWSDGYRRALATGRRAERYAMERELKDAARLRRWTDEQINGILALLQEHAGYLYAHGHALALAQHVFHQACLKLDPATAPAFFAEVLNNGGSAHYGLGAAVEEARQWGVLLLPPCINRSTDRYAVVSPDALELLTAGSATSISRAIRVPLTAIRGLGAETVRHILQMRIVFGPFTSLLDFLRCMEPAQINRRELQVLVRLGAFSFTGRSRAQLALVEHIYATAGELLRATDRDPADLGHLEDELPEMLGGHITAIEWPPERVAADELAHLGFYVVPNDVQQHALRISEEFSTLDIAALAGQQHNTVVSIAGVITTLRIRQTKKGEQMAWLTLTDGTGAIECAIFPNGFARLGQPTTTVPGRSERSRLSSLAGLDRAAASGPRGGHATRARARSGRTIFCATPFNEVSALVTSRQQVSSLSV
jgi:DNA polymerase III alpha subunit